MTLRQQKKGRHATPWSIEELAAGLAHFHKEHQRYPTATEVDTYAYLPSARSIERRFGGLVALRTQLKLGTEHDFRAGTHSSKRAHTINARAHSIEKKVYESLEIMRQYPVIFLQMNEDMKENVLKDLVENKSKKLPTGQYLMGWKTFETFCKSRTPLALLEGKQD